MRDLAGPQQQGHVAYQAGSAVVQASRSRSEATPRAQGDDSDTDETASRESSESRTDRSRSALPSAWAVSSSHGPTMHHDEPSFAPRSPCIVPLSRRVGASTMSLALVLGMSPSASATIVNTAVASDARQLAPGAQAMHTSSCAH
jgi:hypothetical protein